VSLEPGTRARIERIDDVEQPVQPTGTMRGRGNAGGMGGKCPSIEPANQFSEALPAGEYHLVMSSDGGVEAFDYKLELTLVTD